MQLDRRQGQLLGDVRVLQLAGLVDRFALHPLGGQRAGRDRRAAAERLEFGVDDLAVVVHLDLQLHDVAAGGRTDQPGAHRHVLLVQRADVARILVVLQHLPFRN